MRLQEDIGLDVLVHGEVERNDMVQYFAELLDGFAATRNGWVQSYGSRCVRPPVLYGDVARPAPMTVEWTRYAQSLTDRPVKGIVTGPVTMLPARSAAPTWRRRSPRSSRWWSVTRTETAGTAIIRSTSRRSAGCRGAADRRAYLTGRWEPSGSPAGAAGRRSIRI